MSDFKHTAKLNGATLNLALEGSIDEDAEFPVVDTNTVKSVIIDLNGIRAINSVGIREWLAWIRPLSQGVAITLERCPKAMVLQFNMVDGFLPPKAKVSSFYVPYFCEKCDFEGSHLFTMGKHVTNGPNGPVISFNAKAASNCSQADCGIEIDVSEAKYFQFIKRL